jgi:hypothetical protein
MPRYGLKSNHDSFEQCGLVAFKAFKFRDSRTFRRNTLPLSSGSKSKPSKKGRVIAQAVSRRLPIAAAQVRATVRSLGFVVDEVALGQVFSEYFGFPCHFSLYRLLYTHHLSSGAGSIGQLVADVPSGLSLTPV